MADTKMSVIIDMENRISKEINKVKGEVDSFSDTIKKTGAALVTYFSAGAFINFVNETVQASNTLNNALLGLSSVSAAFGQNVDATTQAARKLASDGLMSVSDAATSLKNLLASGFSLDQAIDLMNGFRDSAAFGRQGALSFGEAIRGATEGLKNGNSILVDNAGVTKNLSNILVEAGFSAQDLSKATTDATVRMALYNGILQETSIFQGDAARLTETLSGAQARMTTATFNLKAAIGDALAPTMTVLIADMTKQIELFTGYVTGADGSTVATVGLSEAQNQTSSTGNNFAQSVYRATNFLVALGKGLGIVIQVIVNFASNMVDAGKAAFSFVKDIAGGISNLINAFSKFTSGDIEGAKDAIASLNSDFLSNTKKTLSEYRLNNEAATSVVQAKWDSLGESMLRAVDLKDFKSTINTATREASQSIDNVSSSASKSKDSIKDLSKELEKATEEYASLSKEAEKKLIDLRLDHEENIGRIDEKLADLGMSYRETQENLKKRLKEMEEDHRRSLGNIDEQISSVRDNIAKLGEDLQKTQASNIRSLAEEFVKAEDTIAGLQAKLAEPLSTTERTELEEKLAKEEAALAMFAEQQALYASEIEAVREYNNLTDLERAMLAFEQKMTLAQQEYDQKLELFNQEIAKLEEKRQYEIKQHRERVKEMENETGKRLQNIALEIGQLQIQKMAEEMLYKQKTEIINATLAEAEKYRQEIQKQTFEITKDTVTKEIDLYKKLAAAIREVANARGGSIGSMRIPAMAEGGIVNKPTLAMIGEAGSEAVIPLSKLGNMNTGGGGVNIYINDGNFLGDENEIAMMLGDRVLQQMKLATQVT